MKNKRNKKILSGILMALSLSSSVSINNKVANANYKDEDRSNLNKFVSSIKDSKENASAVAQNLLNAISGIYKNRSQHNRNSVLYKSMQANDKMKILSNDNIEEKYKQYGPDATKAMILGLGVDKFKGGHFTVWDEQTKSAVNAFINKLTDEINCCDAWFYALGGKQKDIDEYKNLRTSYKLKIAKTSNDKQELLKTGKFTNDEVNEVSAINGDIDRQWGSLKDENLDTKKDFLRNVLTIYSIENIKNKGTSREFYSQCDAKLCKIIVDKFLGCKNGNYSEETEAKIYFVYKKLFEKLQLREIEKLYNEYNEKSYPVSNSDEYTDFCKKLYENFLKKNPERKFPEVLTPSYNNGQSSDSSYLDFTHNNNDNMYTAFLNFSYLDRKDAIKMFDEIIYGNLEYNDILQRIANEAYKTLIDKDDFFKSEFGDYYEDYYSMMLKKLADLNGKQLNDYLNLNGF